jgi:uncharacterized protein (DUF433 family)
MTRGHLGNDGNSPVSLDDPHYTVPLYQKAEAARIIRVPRGTLRDWANPASSALRPADVRAALTTTDSPQARAAARLLAGRRRWTDGELHMIIDRLPAHELDIIRSSVPALITTAEPVTPRGPTVPFVGLTEAYVLAAFRRAGVPMQRIRPAIRVLEERMGLRQALASERLKTDGAEVLWDYGQVTDDQSEKDAVGDLVVVRNGQGVFRAVVADYLRRVTYKDGWARIINVGAGKVNVTVDPWVNGGRPTLQSRGIAADDVLSRIRAGESSKAVAADYGLRLAEVTALLELAA